MAKPDELPQQQILGLLRRRLWMPVVCGIVGAAIGIGVSMIQPKQYTATATLLFGGQGDSLVQSLLGQSSLGSTSNDPTVELATNVQLVALHAVDAAVAGSVGGRSTADGISKQIQVSPQGASNIVDVIATTRNAGYSARLANAFASTFVRFRTSIDAASIKSTLALAQRQFRALTGSQQQGSLGRALQTRIEQLSLAASLVSGNAQVVSAAVRPSLPSSPHTRTNGVIAGLIGVLLGLFGSLLSERLDRKLRAAGQLGSISDKPLLGELPLVERGETEKLTLDPVAAEAFQFLRANLRYFRTGGAALKTLLVTSPQPGDGKSFVSFHLAASAAMSGSRVLLVEADLRKPGRWPDRGGLAQVLAGLLDPSEAVHTVRLREGDEGSTTLDVLPNGPSPPNPAELLGSLSMKELLDLCTQDYDLVVVDTAPTLVVSDAIPLTGWVSAVLCLARMNQTDLARLSQLINQLDQLGAPFVGFVLNGARKTGNYDYYNYMVGSVVTADKTKGSR